MTISSGNNILVMQSGGCTPVINRSLYGVVQEAFASKAFERIYGAMYGMEGILDEKLADLRAVDSDEWERIANTPAAALGSTRRKLRTEDVPVIIDVLKRNATMGAGRDAEAMGLAAPVTIIEVMGRDAGWLAASAAAAKQEERDAPHIIGLPEVPMDETRFLDRIEQAYTKYGFAVAVMAENTRGSDGIIGGDSEPWYVDDFGHAYFDGPGRYLAGQVSKRLKVRARYEKPGTIQRSMMACVSESDASEAEEAGREAIRRATAGESGIIITLERAPGPEYSCNTGTAPLAEVGGKVKTMPPEYLDTANDFVTESFLEYLRPLLGSPLPAYGRVR